VVSLALFIATGVGIYFYFKNEKLRVEEKKREERASKSVGKVKIGGPFELVNAQDGKPFTEKDLLGKFNLIYVRSPFSLFETSSSVVTSSSDESLLYLGCSVRIYKLSRYLS
jgi:hypothetical protein